MGGNVQELFSKVKIRDVMNKFTVAVHDDDDLSLAQEKFLNHSVSHLLVLDGSEQLVGLISQKYLYKTYSPRKIIGETHQYDKTVLLDGDSYFDKKSLNRHILCAMMKKNPFVMSPENTVLESIVEMDRQNLGCIPIVNKSREVEGILTNQEIVKFIAYVLVN